MRVLTAAVLIALSCCSKSQRKPEAPPPTVPLASPADAAPPVAQPVTKPSPRPADCQLALVTTVAGQPSGTLSGSDELTLEAVVENPTATELSVMIQHDCPGMDARFTGFGDVKLYDSSCMMGRCAPGSTYAKKLTVPAGGRVSVSTASLRRKMPCANAEVAPGTYSVSFALPILSTDAPRTCAEPATVTVK